jgi:hypothetical protein
MALVSTFEVVLKPQLPTDLPPVLNTVRNLGHNVIQFLEALRNQQS